MYYIFIDESGDLGDKGSKYFVLAAIKVEDEKVLEKLIKKTRRNYKKDIGQSNEIKGSKTPPKVKKYILKKLNRHDYKVFILIFDKKNKYKFDFNQDNHKLYALLAAELAKIISIDDSTYFFIDRTSRYEETINYFDGLFEDNLINPKNYPILIKHVDSLKYKGIQIADLLSWSVYQDIENNNDEYSKLIKNMKIKEVFED